MAYIVNNTTRTLRGTVIAISSTAAFCIFWFWIVSVLPCWGHVIVIGIIALIAFIDPCLADFIDQEPFDSDERVGILDLVFALPGALVTGCIAASLAVTFPAVTSQTVAFWCGFAAWSGFFAFLTHLHYKPKNRRQ